MKSQPSNISDMTAVILAGGQGTRMQELTENIPKPLVTIGPHPIIWHIMKIYTAFGVRKFVIAAGYKNQLIKQFFLNFPAYANSIKIDLPTGKFSCLTDISEDWEVSIIDTGEKTETGGRLKALEPFIEKQRFFFTYGDGVADVNLDALLAYHMSHNALSTVTAVRPKSKFGALTLSDDGALVRDFSEKPEEGNSIISGGFFVFEPEIFNYISDDLSENFELNSLVKVTKDHQLAAYRHHGFWQCMDTTKDVRELNALWHDGQAMWTKYWR